MRLVLDIENSTTDILVGDKKKVDLLPFHGTNELISVGVKDIDTGKHWYYFFNHKDITDDNTLKDSFDGVQYLLNKASLLIGHNFKHDLIWLLSCGFKVPCKKFWDTMIVEYVLAKGQVGQSFSLEALCEKHDLPLKKVHLTKGSKFQDLPKETIEEYGIGDLDSTEALFKKQELRLYEKKNRSLVPTINMMNEFMEVLTKWQCNGIKIDRKELERVRKEYVEEKDALVKRLNKIARNVLGDTPFNLNSPDDRSMLLYSRRIKDKNEWKKKFNIGTDARGKKKRRPRMRPKEFKDAVRGLTEVVYRTTASQCKTCKGAGRHTFTRKDGSESKAKRICKDCGGAGALYTRQNRVAGFKFIPESVKDVSAGGFETNHKKLLHLSKIAPSDEAKEFVLGLIRLNAVSTYISTFCDGILNNLTKRNFLHTNFNQAITATGRLSSSDPNFQNQPRGNTFPVRRAVISRFPGGSITEADYGQLEFRCAADLAKDEQALQDILDKMDVHVFTRDTLNAAGLDIDRQGAKAHTFKPLYGGEFGTEAEMTYYRAFKARYPGIATYQVNACESVGATGILELPSGRQYHWPKAYRDFNGTIQPKTQIVNYPVQGFATGDIVPLACILIDKEFTARKLKSVPFLTVHDSIAVDTHPDEKDIVAHVLAECMLNVKQDMMLRYNYEFTVPLSVEVKCGINWLDAEVVLTKEHKYDKTVVSELNDNDEFYDDPLDDIGVA